MFTFASEKGDWITAILDIKYVGQKGSWGVYNMFVFCGATFVYAVQM